MSISFKQIEKLKRIISIFSLKCVENFIGSMFLYFPTHPLLEHRLEVVFGEFAKLRQWHFSLQQGRWNVGYLYVLPEYFQKIGNNLSIVSKFIQYRMSLLITYYSCWMLLCYYLLNWSWISHTITQFLGTLVQLLI